MKYMVRRSLIYILGRNWMPGCICAQTIELREYDIENIRSPIHGLNREAIGQWLTCHTGDFQSIIDFSASIEDGDNTVNVEWKEEDSEMLFNDCMYPVED